MDQCSIDSSWSYLTSNEHIKLICQLTNVNMLLFLGTYSHITVSNVWLAFSMPFVSLSTVAVS